MRNFWIYGVIALGAATLGGAAIAQDKAENKIGPIDNLQDLEDTARMLFKLADTNNDGQISQKEATDAGNLLVGGFFFRADTNGDGVLSQDEARQARDNLFAQQPLLRLVLDKAKPTNAPAANQPLAAPNANDPARVAQNLAQDPARTVGSMLDTNHDQKIEATELRQAVQTGVQSLFMVADANQDGQLSPYELNAAVGEVAKSAVQNVFQAADADRNGQLSMEEYDKALAEPAHAVFRVIDANSDNQISLAELQRAEQILADQIQRLRVREPGNSISNQLQNGRGSSDTARTQTQPVPPTTAPGTPVAAPTPR